MSPRVDPRDRPELVEFSRRVLTPGGRFPLRLRERPARLAYVVVGVPVGAFSAYQLIRMFGQAVAFWQLLLLSFAVAVTVILPTFLTVATAPMRTAPHGVPPARQRPFSEANRWEDRLSWTDGDVDRFNDIVRTRLVDLLAERLRLRHGVDLRADPRRARSVLPESLYRLVTRPVAEAPTKSEVDEIVRLIETV